MPRPKSGLEYIVESRAKALDRYASDHDLTHHDAGDLITAAECYMRDARYQLGGAEGMTAPPPRWPFIPSDWRTGTAVEQLARAGSFIAGEIDRTLGLHDIVDGQA